MTHLQIHVKSKHEEKSESTKNQVKKTEEKTECPICKAIFGKTNLKKHIRTKHEGKKDYKCDLCGNQYFEKKRLNRHIKKEHDKIRDEKCSQCGKLYFSKDVIQFSHGVYGNFGLHSSIMRLDVFVILESHIGTVGTV